MKPTITMNRNSSSISAQEAYEKFIRLKKLKKLSPESISYYDNGFRYFGEFFDITCQCAQITRETIYSYLEHLQTTRNANGITINTYLKALRTILYYFMEEGYMQRFKIELVKAEKKSRKLTPKKSLKSRYISRI